MRLALLTGAFALGVGTALGMPLPWTALALWGVGVLALGGLLRLEGLPLTPALLALAFLLGAVRGTLGQPPPPPAPPPGEVQVMGQVAGPVEVEGLRVWFVLRPEAPGSAPMRVSADLPAGLVEAKGLLPLWPGDRVRVVGTVHPASPYWVREGVPWFLRARRLEAEPAPPTPTALLPRLRQAWAGALDRSLPPREAGLAQALLLGLRGNLDPEMRRDFRASGTAHLLAVSGLHVGMVLAGGLALARWMAGGYRWGLLLPLAGVWAYALLAGLGAPVVRAGGMASAFLLARLLGRERTPLHALALAVLAMVALRPSYLLSPSFQMSVSAVAGILLLAEPLSRALRLRPPEGAQGWGARLRRAVGGGMAVSLSAGLAVAPLVALYFEQASPWGLVATPLALPALPPALILSALTALAGLTWSPLGEAVGVLAWPFLAWPIAVARLFARLPGAGVETGPLLPLLALGLALLVAGGPSLLRLLRGLRAPAPHRLLPLAGALALAVWVPALLTPDGLLHLRPLDGGRAVLVQGPHGTRLLVVGRARPGPLRADLANALPFWVRGLDGLLLVGAEGQGAAAEVLRRYRVRALLALPPALPALAPLARAEGTPLHPLTPGAQVRMRGGPLLTAEETGEGVRLRLRYGRLDLALEGPRPWGPEAPWPRGFATDGRRLWAPP